MADRIRIEAFGRHMDIERIDDRWVTFLRGNEGKRRPAPDVLIPASLEKSDIIDYLEDLLHESASEKHPNVIVLDA
jgi:hypothetical protein